MSAPFMRQTVIVVFLLAVVAPVLAACDMGAAEPAKTAAPQAKSTVPGGRVYLPLIGNAPASAPQPAAASPAATTAPAAPASTVNPTAAAVLRPGTTPTPAARGTGVAPTATLVAQRIQFPAGASSTTLNGTLAPTAVNRYLVNIAAKQRLTIKLAATQGVINFSVVAADGTTQKKPDEPAPNGTWSMQMVKTQDYRITLSEASRAAGAYTLNVTVGP